MLLLLLLLFPDKYYYDDLALCLLLKGCCLRYMGSPLQAEECFLQVTKMDKLIVDDAYLVPYSVAEVGFLYQATGKPEDAIIWLEAAKYIVFPLLIDVSPVILCGLSIQLF